MAQRGSMPKWQARMEPVDGGQRYQILLGDEPISYEQVVAAWCDDVEFCRWFATLLKHATYAAYRWETPPVTSASLQQPFEFVLLDSPRLDRPVDRTAFAEHFSQAANGIATFSNLGGDAVMVVPCPTSDDSTYTHLATFIRQAPPEQVNRLWQAVGRALQERVGERPVWLSTAGMGVAWLHVRLDSRPKYYGYRPYTQF